MALPNIRCWRAHSGPEEESEASNVEVVESIGASSKGLKILFDDFQSNWSDGENKSNKTEVDEPNHSVNSGLQSVEKKTGIIMDITQFSKSAKNDQKHQKDLKIKDEDGSGELRLSYQRK